MAASDLERLRAAWLRFVVVAAGIAVVVIVIIAVNWPRPFDAVYQRLVFADTVPAWQRPPPLESLAGCYVLSLGEWMPKGDLGPDATFATPPKTIEFTLMPFSRTGGDDVYVVRPPAGANGSIHSWSTWELTPDGTVSVRFSTGFSGLSMELGPAGPDLVGRAKTFWDFPRISQWATARATQTPCPEQAAEEPSMQRPSNEGMHQTGR
jgi:hypothetical protein